MDEKQAMKWALEALAHKAEKWAEGDYSPHIITVEDPKDNQLVRRAFEKLAAELDERARKSQSKHKPTRAER